MAIFTDRKWAQKLTSYGFVNKRILSSTFKLDRHYLIVIEVYTTEERKMNNDVFSEQL